MALVNHDTKEVQFKIVYCGPEFAGKTTNLQHIRGRIDEDRRGDLLSMPTSTDRSRFFDYLPIDAVLIRGFHTKFQLYTVPGSVRYAATQMLILRGADAIIFVADSSPERQDANREAFASLVEALRMNGTPLEDLPFAVQCNKRDVPGAVHVAEIVSAIGRGPGIEAVAAQGFNVFATLNLVAEEALQRFHATVDGN